MRRKFLILTTMLILVVIGLFLFGCQTTGNTAGTGNSSQQQGIWVSGEGKVFASPDIANLRLGISAQADTVAGAQNQANIAMNSVMNALTVNGVAGKDIQTSNFSVQKVTRWDQDKQQEVTIGYTVTNMVNAKIRNVGNTGIVIDEVTKAGGDLTRVDNITFTIEDPLPYYDQARQKAMADAKDRAKSLADLSGVKLGKPVYISESTGGGATPIYLNAAKGAASDSTATSISAGELEITLNIQMVYSIK
jgi:uncharacterized protein YggE